MKRLLILAALAFNTVSFPILASNAYVDAVLDALSAKGLLTEADVISIKAKAAAEERQQLATQIVESKPATAQNPISNFVAQSLAQTEFPAFKVWGRLQPRYTYIAAENGLEGTNSFTFRRARMGVKGYLADRIAFRTQYEAANQVPGLPNAENLLDAWVRFEHLDDSFGTITIGQQFIPGYGRAPQLGASVERKFTEFLSPGAAGRARGISLRRGDFGLPEASSKGLFGNRLHYGIGMFNAPDLSLDNDNSEMLYAIAIGLRPTGVSPYLDEYQVVDRGFTYSLAGSYARSNDSGTLDTGVIGVDLKNEWFTMFNDLQYHHWYAWSAWTRFVSESDGNQLLNTNNVLSDKLDSTAMTLGLTRTFPLLGDTAWALGFQYQTVDNEHPSRTRFLRTLTGRSPDELARGMDDGDAYHFMFTWIFGRNVRLINEFILYDVDTSYSAGQFDHEAFVSQLQVDF